VNFLKNSYQIHLIICILTTKNVFNFNDVILPRFSSTVFGAEHIRTFVEYLMPSSFKRQRRQFLKCFGCHCRWSLHLKIWHQMSASAFVVCIWISLVLGSQFPVPSSQIPDPTLEKGSSVCPLDLNEFFKYLCTYVYAPKFWTVVGQRQHQQLSFIPLSSGTHWHFLYIAHHYYGFYSNFKTKKPEQ